MSEYIEIDAGETLWRFEKTFLTSNWTCIWGRGCKGIMSQPDTENGHGCCSLGAELDVDDDAQRVSALAPTLTEDIFQFHDEAATGGVFKDSSMNATRVIDGACIFLNRPGFSGGAGCALHLGALKYGEHPVDWKPSVCWQLPIKVEWQMRDDDVEVATMRGWQRKDWGDHASELNWCCTEGPEAYVGETNVITSLSTEIAEIVGEPVFIRLQKKIEDAEKS